MKPTRTEKQDAIKGEIVRLQNAITPFHTSKEKEAVKRSIEVFRAILKDYEVDEGVQGSLF